MAVYPEPHAVGCAVGLSPSHGMKAEVTDTISRSGPYKHPREMLPMVSAQFMWWSWARSIDSHTVKLWGPTMGGVGPWITAPTDVTCHLGPLVLDVMRTRHKFQLCGSAESLESVSQHILELWFELQESGCRTLFPIPSIPEISQIEQAAYTGVTPRKYSATSKLLQTEPSFPSGLENLPLNNHKCDSINHSHFKFYVLGSCLIAFSPQDNPAY